jgi:hypothetical protein
MVVLSILRDQNKIKVMCNIEMWVLHDESTQLVNVEQIRILHP